MTTGRLIEPAPSHLRPSRFSHLVLKTRQFDERTAWYKTVLSAGPMFENAVVGLLSYDEEHHRVMIGHDPNASPRGPRVAGVVHFAYAVETLEDLVNTCLRLMGLGCVLTALLCGREKEVRALLGIPEPWATRACAPIGRPIGGGHGPLTRRPIEAVAVGDRFGAPLFNEQQEKSA